MFVSLEQSEKYTEEAMGVYNDFSLKVSGFSKLWKFISLYDGNNIYVLSINTHFTLEFVI